MYSNLYANCESYYNSPKFSDVKIQISHFGRDCRDIYAHKIVLAAGSSAFREYFENHDQVRQSLVEHIDLWVALQANRT